MAVLDRLLDLAGEVNKDIEVVTRGVTPRGIHGSLHYRGYRSGFRIEIEDPQYLFESKKRFTKAGAQRRLLRHIDAHAEDIKSSMRGFVERTEEELAALGAEEPTQQEA